MDFDPAQIDRIRLAVELFECSGELLNRDADRWYAGSGGGGDAGAQGRQHLVDIHPLARIENCKRQAVELVGMACWAGGQPGQSAALAARLPCHLVHDRLPVARILVYEFLEALRSEEHTSELQSLQRISYAV